MLGSHSAERINMKASIALFVLGLVGQTCAGSNSAQSAFSIPSNHEASAATSDAMQALLDRYAPVFKLSKEEEWFPSSIEYMLPHFAYDEDGRGDRTPLNRSLLTPSQLDELPLSGIDSWLSLKEEHNAQPDLAPESEFLRGPYWTRRRQLAHGQEKGNYSVEAPVYGFWVSRDRGVVDLWYWTYYPYNFGKEVGRFGWLDNHVSDWERLVIRTINGTAVSVDFNVHNGGSQNAGTIRWIDAPQIEDRPVAYVAAGSHGVWPTPGIHVFEELLDVFQLADITDDEGPLWDTKGHVVDFEFWDQRRRHGMIHFGEASWLNFKGRWGNKGVKDCWWHRMIPYCQLADAPPGPNRDVMLDPPQCVIAPLSLQRSKYSFYLSQALVEFAEEQGVTKVKVEQICARPKQPKHAPGSDRKGMMLYMEESAKDDDLVWTMNDGTAPFAGAARHSYHPVTGESRLFVRIVYRSAAEMASALRILQGEISVLSRLGLWDMSLVAQWM